VTVDLPPVISTPGGVFCFSRCEYVYLHFHSEPNFWNFSGRDFFRSLRGEGEPPSSSFNGSFSPNLSGRGQSGADVFFQGTRVKVLNAIDCFQANGGFLYGMCPSRGNHRLIFYIGLIVEYKHSARLGKSIYEGR
jgi:hypothetical protein